MMNNSKLSAMIFLTLLNSNSQNYFLKINNTMFQNNFYITRSLVISHSQDFFLLNHVTAQNLKNRIISVLKIPVFSPHTLIFLAFFSKTNNAAVTNNYTTPISPTLPMILLLTYNSLLPKCLQNMHIFYYYQ